MKRVLHVLASLERSGLEKMLLCSGAEWSRQGYASDVLATKHDLGPLADAMAAAGYGIYHLPFRGRLRYLPSGRFLAGYWRLCRSGYDIIHIHSEAAALLFAVLAWVNGVPKIVRTPHNTFHFHGLLRARKFMERWIMRRMGCRFAMISDDVKQCEWERYRNPGIRVSNWLDADHFRPPTAEERDQAREKLGMGSQHLVVVSVGNCNAAKNHPALLRALKLVARQHELLYLHIGREAADGAERRLAEESGLAERVRFLGSQADPRPYLWAADLFVMPSLYEGVGISALEAIAAGLPVVLSEVPGLREVAAGTQGAVLTTTEPESIAAGVLQVAKAIENRHMPWIAADSLTVRTQFSAQRGVESIIAAVYDPA